jgi:hypothetical protein
MDYRKRKITPLVRIQNYECRVNPERLFELTGEILRLVAYAQRPGISLGRT